MHRFLSSLTLGALMIAAPVLRAQDKDIVDTAIAAGNFTTLVKAVQAAGLVDTLKGAGPFTVFAPTDDAFAKLPPGALDKLIANPDQLKKVLLYHVVAGKVTAADVTKLKTAKTVEGSPVRIKVDGDTVMINNAKVVKADVMASNGVIHAVDTVLMPGPSKMSKMSKMDKNSRM